MTFARLFAIAAAVAALLLVPGGAFGTNSVLPFDGTIPIGADGHPTCAAPFTFDSGSGTKSIDVVATTDVPANDILLKLFGPDGSLLASADTATSPEAIHYSPGGDIAPGKYQAVVCPFGDLTVADVATYHGTVTLSEAGATTPGVVLNPPASGPAPSVTYDTSAGITYGPATMVSANFLCGEPQITVEKPVARTNASAGIDPKRMYVDCPMGSRSNTSLLSRTTDGGQSFRLLLDPACAPRNRANCLTSGGGDSEEDVNPVTGTLLFADQEVLANEALASSTDHGDTFPANRQFAISNETTATDRQWLAWVDPANATVLGQGLEGFLTWHLGGVGQYVIGIGPGGVPLPQPVPQIPDVGQSGQVKVDNNDNSPGRGWIYQPYGSFAFGGIVVATAQAPRYQDPTAWQSTMVSADSRQIFPWIAIDDAGNAYLTWADDNGQAWISASPINDPRNNPQLGGRPGSYWTIQAKVNPPNIKSTAFVEVTAGAAGRIAVAYMGSSDCTPDGNQHAPDDCATSAHWNTYTAVMTDATQLWKGGVTNIQIGQVNHRVVHTASICTSGTTCGTTCTPATPCTGDRSLVDMMDVSSDADGRVTVVFMDNNNKLGNIVGDAGGKNGPFVEVAKMTTGPSLKGGTINVSVPTGGRSDAAGDATWPNTAAGTNLRSLDLLGASVSNTDTTLTATINAADTTLAGMARDLAAYNAVSPTDQRARLVYVARIETQAGIYHLDLEYKDGALRYYGGEIDANDAVTSVVTVVGARYATDAGYTVTGTAANGKITLSIPLAKLGLSAGDKIINVAAYAMAAPAEDDPAAVSFLNSARTVDATPPFDATIKAPPAADIASSQTASPSSVKKGKTVTFTATVRNNGPDAASGVSLRDTLPTTLSYKSASASAGLCTQSKGVVSCSLGTLANNASATVTIVATATSKGTITNTATASSTSPPDPNGGNNASSASVTVT
jgi:uncharacterized repeat protein (TIGR01451 family)